MADDARNPVEIGDIFLSRDGMFLLIIVGAWIEGHALCLVKVIPRTYAVWLVHVALRWGPDALCRRRETIECQPASKDILGKLLCRTDRRLSRVSDMITMAAQLRPEIYAPNIQSITRTAAEAALEIAKMRGYADTHVQEFAALKGLVEASRDDAVFQSPFWMGAALTVADMWKTVEESAE